MSKYTDMSMGRREYMATAAAALMGTSGCAETQEERLEKTSINELLENPESFTGEPVRTSGEPEYEGNVTYTFTRYNHNLEMFQAVPITQETYILHTEDGKQEITFRTDYEPDFLETLEEGEKFGKQVEVVGSFEEVEKDGKKVHMITGAEVDSLETATSSI